MSASILTNTCQVCGAEESLDSKRAAPMPADIREKFAAMRGGKPTKTNDLSTTEGN